MIDVQISIGVETGFNMMVEDLALLSTLSTTNLRGTGMEAEDVQMEVSAVEVEFG